MKSPFFFAIPFIVLIGGCSCGPTDYDRAMAKRDICIKEKSNKLKFKDIDESLSNFDFSTARMYLGCEPNIDFEANGIRSEYHDITGIYIKINPYKEALKKISQAEISYWFANDNIQKAENVARESNMVSIYQEGIIRYAHKLINQGKTNEAVDLLNEIDDNGTYNKLLENIIDGYLIKDSVFKAKKMVKLMKTDDVWNHSHDSYHKDDWYTKKRVEKKVIDFNK